MRTSKAGEIVFLDQGAFRIFFLDGTEGRWCRKEALNLQPQSRHTIKYKKGRGFARPLKSVLDSELATPWQSASCPQSPKQAVRIGVHPWEYNLSVVLYSIAACRRERVRLSDGSYLVLLNQSPESRGVRCTDRFACRHEQTPPSLANEH